MKNKTINIITYLANIITYLAKWIILAIYIIKVLMFVQKAFENTVTFDDLISLPSDIKDIYNTICDIKYYSDKF